MSKSDGLAQNFAIYGMLWSLIMTNLDRIQNYRLKQLPLQQPAAKNTQNTGLLKQQNALNVSSVH